MANARSTGVLSSGKRRSLTKRRFFTKGRKPAGLAAGSGTGMFLYRGLKIKPTFVEDDRSRQLEDAMREIAMKNHLVGE
ncbi:hypothetical protein [Sphingomonas sp. ZB1N12]|uniref:hypothetical protein n=1 Tax=Sphingomonas arabinosi TaxID=3096160 RepID=UPI002FCABCED